ncbi:MAG: C40 family peptidase [Ferruginibacter sp.]|nr:C40 family peptidase [Ferruginibacter sp.]
MNKFMGGLTLGIIATTCFFIFFKPFQKTISDSGSADSRQDTIVVAPGVSSDSPQVVLPVQPQVQAQSRDRASRDSLVTFAKTLLGTPYLYGSVDPAKGFDCSGFITHVFNHFNIAVPRSSFEFGPIGKKRTLQTCKRGDLILFTGTNPLERDIGHIGIVCDFVNGQPSFIHSSSGKAHGVTITSMGNKFYQERFMSVIDLLESN